jgi:glycosidase
MRHLLPDCWYKLAAGIPADGATAYNGLDTKDYYRIDPELGTMDDFRHAVRLAHSKRLAVTIFINLGYLSVLAQDWIQAQKDKRAGVKSELVKRFLWSDKPDAPPPPTQEDVLVTQQQRDHDKAYWGWHYSDAAASYFWSRWKADGPGGSVIPLPQMNWGDPGWRQEAERIVRFWMDTGIDGMVIDAPLCYPNQTWAENLQSITSIVASYGNTMIDPEGGRNTTAWITEAGYNTMHDYYPKFVKAIDSGNSSDIEARLEGMHDSITEQGGVLYSRFWSGNYFNDPERHHLLEALMAASGDIVVYTREHKDQKEPDSEETRILNLKAMHPALFPTATRSRLATNADNKYYAVLATAKDGSERVVAVYNLQPTAQKVELVLGVVDTPGIVDARSAEIIPRPNQFDPIPIELPAFGYRFFTVLPSL